MYKEDIKSDLRSDAVHSLKPPSNLIIPEFLNMEGDMGRACSMRHIFMYL
jgi:hypothetical protein